jgi:peptide/nickel transport system permease protein
VVRLLARRLAISVALIIIIPALTFVLEALTPGNAAQAQLGVSATPQQLRQLERQLGLDKPLWDRYLIWFGHFLHGNLGKSLFTGQAVTQELNSRLPVSLSLIFGSIIVVAVLGILIGVLSARRTGIVGRSIETISVLGIAVPNFWLAVILIEFFAVKLHILPATGYVDFTASPASWARSLVLPVVALAFAGITAVAKQTRDQMKDVLDRDFIRNLRANGVGERSIVYRHALRAAAIPVVTMLGLLFVGALSGSVIVENVFVLPGLGSAAVQATTSQDYPVIQGISIYFTVMVIAVNIIVDLAYGWLNPRVRSV